MGKVRFGEVTIEAKSIDRFLDPHQTVEVIGYDNLLFTDLMLPSLTTIHQPKRDLGRETGKLVLKALADKKMPPEQIKLPPELILRASTGGIRV